MMTMQQRRNEANNASSWISKREINKFIRKRRDRKQILKSSEFATKYQEPSGKVFHKKSQSAMEYLMTYGWAILIIAIVLVAFFSLNLFNPYTFSPKASPGSCQILRPNGPGSNLFVSEVGLCNTNEIPQYVARLSAGNVTSIKMSRPASMPLGTISAVTYTAWINPGIFIPAGSSVVSQGRSDTFVVSGNYLLFLHECASPGDTYISVNSNVNLQNGKWHFIALSYSQNANIIIAEIDNYTASTPPTGGPPTISSSTAIGWSLCGPQQSFSGQIANVQIYNTSLSASELQSLYSEGIGGAPINIQNLAGWWPLNGNANDYSGNGNNGVPTNVIFTSSWENGYSSP